MSAVAFISSIIAIIIIILIVIINAGFRARGNMIIFGRGRNNSALLFSRKRSIRSGREGRGGVLIFERFVAMCEF